MCEEKECCHTREKITNFLRDPSSNFFSMSRFLLGTVILFGIPVMIYCVATNLFPAKEGTNLVLGIVASLCTVYAINSGAGAYGKSKYRCEEKEEEKGILDTVKNVIKGN